MQKKRVLQVKRNLQLSLMNEIQFLYNEGNCSKCSLFWCRKNVSLSLKQQLAISEDAILCFHRKKNELCEIYVCDVENAISIRVVTSLVFD